MISSDGTFIGSITNLNKTKFDKAKFDIEVSISKNVIETDIIINSYTKSGSHTWKSSGWATVITEVSEANFKDAIVNAMQY